MPGRLILLIVCFALSGCGEEATFYKRAAVISSSRLKPPFSLEKPRGPQAARPNGDTDCEPPPPPVRDLAFEGFYRAGSGSSVVDPVAMRRYRAGRKPVRRYQNALVRLSDRYLEARNPGVAACALTWLARWARAGGFLGRVSRQGGYERKWALGVVSMVYLKIRDAGGLEAGDKQAVERWIGRWAAVVHEDYADFGKAHLASRNNNHAYWAAWSLGLAGVVLNERALFDYMLARYRAAMRQITPEGTLPLETARGAKALHYHLYASAALVMMAELAARNGVELYEAEGGALGRLIGRTVAGLSDPSFFARKTGQRQNWVGRLNGSKLAWMEAYYARRRDAKLKPWIDKFRPMKNRLLGGDATLLYGVKPLR